MKRAGSSLNLSVISCVCLMFLLGGASVPCAAQGALTPPGAPVPTMKTLDQVEPRIPINPASFPYVIDQPGSYYLTGNIKVNDINTTGILIAVGGVTIDLCGFEIRGPGRSVGDYGSGIAVVGGEFSLGAIIDGTILDFRGDGLMFNRMPAFPVSLAYVSVRNVTVRSSGGNGMTLGEKSLVSGCTASFNMGVGIAGYAFGTIRECMVDNNHKIGIDTFGGDFSITNNQVYACDEYGIRSRLSTVISGNYVESAALDGIWVGSKCQVEDNYVCNGGLNVYMPINGDGAGVHVQGSQNMIKSNNILKSDYAVRVVSTGNMIVGNRSSNNTDPYGSIASGNLVGPIVNSSNVATNTNPDANYEF